MCMIDMAFQGLDPTKQEHHFSLHMAPVSPILEIERHEVIQMKLDRLERGLRMGLDNQFDQNFWVPFVLRTYGGFPDQVIQAMYKGEDGAQGADVNVGSGQFGGYESVVRNGNGKRNGAVPDRKALEEAIIQRLGGSPDPVPVEASTDVVLGTSMIDPESLRSKMTLQEWRSSNKQSRGEAVAANLEDSRGAETRITPLNDAEAARAREALRESRAKVVKNLAMSGGIFNLKPVGSYDRKRKRR